MGDSGVLGGKFECQSASQTVPNDPSPTTLMGVYERSEPGSEKKRERSEKDVKRETIFGRED